MQNGNTVHADVNPTVSAGNDSAKVADENVGVGYSAKASGGINSADSASLVVAAGGATDSKAPSQAAGSPAENATGQGNNAAAVVGESESGASAGQAKPGVNQVVASDNIKAVAGSAAVPNRPASVAAGNSSKGRSFANLSVKPSFLAVSKVASTGTSNNAVNGGFDKATWGTLDVKAWQGHVQGDYYQLTDYTGDANHVIVPNEADFAKAGISTGGKQVGVTSDLMRNLFQKSNANEEATVAFSKTDDKKVKAIDNNWEGTWSTKFDGDTAERKLAYFDGTGLDTSNITNMSHLFYHFDFNNDSTLKILNVSNWDTSNVTNMWGMFRGADKVIDLDVSHWNTSKVINMSEMFYDLSSLTQLDVSHWNTSNVTDISDMFNECSSLTSLDASKWDTHKVTNMYSVFYGDSSLTSLDVSKWDTSKVIDMSDMFAYCSNLTSLDVLHWDTSKVTNMNGMFNGVKKLTSLDVSKWDTSSVNYMDDMFEDDSNLTSLDVSHWNTNHLISTGRMFRNCSGLTVIDLSNWDTSNVTDMIGMFDGTNIALIVNNSNGWQAALDSYETPLRSGEISVITTNPNLLKARDSSDYRLNNDQMYQIDDESMTRSAIFDVTKSPIADQALPVYTKNMTDSQLKQYAADVIKLYNQKLMQDYEKDHPNSHISYVAMQDMSDPIKLTHAVFVTELNTNDAYALDPKNGLHEHANVNDNGGYDADFWGKINVDDWNYTVNGDRIEISGLKDGVSTGANDAVIVPNLDDFKLVGKDDGAETVYISRDALRKTAWHKYYGLSKTNGNTFATDSDLNNAFSDVSNLTHADLNNLNTGNVTDMTSMFYGASSLTNLDVSNWDTSRVTNMFAMFHNTSNLTSLNVSNWTTGNVTNMYAMFYGARRLKNLNVSNWKTGNVTDMRSMFLDTSSLTSLDVSHWDTSKVTNMSYMFVSVKALRRLNISNWNLTKLANKDAMKYMFANDTNYTNLTVIANDLKLPTWYQNEINDADYFWNNRMAVITNVPELIRATGDIDNLKIDDQDASRSIFYDSKGSSDAIQVLKDANQAYIKQYQNDHPGYILNLAADVDQTDPLALANARFVSVPREVHFTIAYYDLTGKLVDSTTSTYKVGETVAVSPVAPANYVLANGQLSMNYLMHWGLNEVDFLVAPKVTTTTQTKTVSRTITVQTPDGQTNNVVQTVAFTRNGYLNQVTKQTTYSPWSFNGQYQFSGYLPKPIDGYTADVVPTVIVTPDSSDTTVKVAYHPISAAYEVDYQLADGTLINKAQNVATNDGMLHLTAPQGYRLLTTVTDVQVGSSSQKLAVLVAPVKQTYTVHDDLPSGVTEPLTKTVTRTVKITMPNGHTRTVKQAVKFTRTATVNADGTVSYGNWQVIGRAQFNKIFVPKRFGYQLSGQADKVAVTANMTDSVVEIKYIKNQINKSSEVTPLGLFFVR